MFRLHSTTSNHINSTLKTFVIACVCVAGSCCVPLAHARAYTIIHLSNVSQSIHRLLFLSPTCCVTDLLKSVVIQVNECKHYCVVTCTRVCYATYKHNPTRWHDLVQVFFSFSFFFFFSLSLSVPPALVCMCCLFSISFIFFLFAKCLPHNSTRSWCVIVRCVYCY